MGHADDKYVIHKVGMFWGALVDGQVNLVVPVRLPKDVTGDRYNQFVSLAKGACSAFGGAAPGDVVKQDGKYFFEKRSHKNRSKSGPRRYPVTCFEPGKEGESLVARCWAGVKGNKAITVFPYSDSDEISRENHRKYMSFACAACKLVGDLQVGSLVQKGGVYYFRPNAKPGNAEPVEYLVTCFGGKRSLGRRVWDEA